MATLPPTKNAFFELGQFEIDRPSVHLLNEKFCRQNFVVVLGRVDPNSTADISLGMLDPEDMTVLQVVRNSLSRPIRGVQLSAFEIRKALDVGYGMGAFIPRKHVKLTLTKVASLNFKGAPSAEEMVSQILGHAIAKGASDIHIEAYEDDVDLRYRVDGVLRQSTTPFGPDQLDAIIAVLKILSDLDIAEKRAAQDGRIHAMLKEGNRSRAIDFRLSLLPGPNGEDAVLRVLDSSKPLVGLGKLGFAKDTLAQFRTLVQNPEGLVLVTGPTGSGKTTTLYSALGVVNNEANKVLTVEDPIEYHFGKINQKQVNQNMSFASYARSFMRQDPDIMMIGEIRDEETADVAMRAAQTGHLVLSTLHANDAVSTISRMETLGIQPNMIADTLLGALSQRLVRKNCLKCREEAPPGELAQQVFTHYKRSFKLRRGAGCAVCEGTGYKGRVGLFELFLVNAEVNAMIAKQSTMVEIRAFARQHGMRTLFEDAIGKVKAGITTFDEIQRAVPYRAIQELLNP